MKGGRSKKKKVHPRGKLDFQLSIPARRKLNCTHRRKLLNPMSKNESDLVDFPLSATWRKQGLNIPEALLLLLLTSVGLRCSVRWPVKAFSQ